jgi:DnaJ-domain-containing protein 1
MQGTSHTDRGATPTPIRPSRFAAGIEQLFGDNLDLDPLFLEDSWTYGIPIALDNLHRRRRQQSERESQHRAFRELDTLASLNFIPSTEPAAVPTPRTPPPAWVPQDWSPQHRIAHSRIPRDWLPPGVPPADAPPPLHASPEPALFPEPAGHPMTPGRAHQLLGVTSTSTREQVRSAYRRRVGECHPDRLQHATEAFRLHATQQLATVNEAYRLLCSTLQQQAA